MWKVYDVGFPIELIFGLSLKVKELFTIRLLKYSKRNANVQSKYAFQKKAKTKKKVVTRYTKVIPVCCISHVSC